MFSWAIYWLIASGVVAIVAIHRGRSGVGWMALSILISPVLAFVLLVCIPAKDGDLIITRDE